MSETTHIEWATHTASPWFGCSKVSPGCTNCYAEKLTLQKKWAGWGDNSPRVRSKGFWHEAYRLDRKARRENFCWACSAPYAERNPNTKPERPRMFTSLMDWLDPKAPIEWLADFLDVVNDCPNLDWLLLTKRPELWRSRLEEVKSHLPHIAHKSRLLAHEWLAGKYPANVWFGVTVENQDMADKRLPILVTIPARVRWLSVEPLLERVDLGLDGIISKDLCSSYTPYGYKIDWVVVGGESGSKRRDCGVYAINNVAHQCLNAKVPCFVKQDCASKPGQKGRIPENIWTLKQYPA